MQTDRSLDKAGSKTVYDAGLHKHLQRIYNRMTIGVMVTAITAWLVSTSPMLLNLFLGGPQMYIVIFAPLAIIWFGFNPARMKASQLKIAFFALSVVYGISFSAIAAMATSDPTFGVAVAKSFLMATAMFAGLSVYGYTTKRDVSGMQTFIVMGIWGLIAASVMNMFFQSPMMHNVIAGVGIVLFSGVTVWQTQAMKNMYSSNQSEEINSRMGWSAALSLYISFIALFQYILHFMSQR